MVYTLESTSQFYSSQVIGVMVKKRKKITPFQHVKEVKGKICNRTLVTRFTASANQR